MFWSGNFIVVRELNFLLKEENVTLSQVLEADDILQECKADNKALMQFLTRPDILAELITLITEEPPASVELSQQYRHASIACEVLTSPLSSLSDRLSLDTAQMNRLCDFINKDPPLNPLLASYFSKTIEMLLERNPKQDWYLYHIVCLRVLDFFKSRRDFLPNLLRHMATSAISDTFKYFIRLDDLFNKIIMEWLEEHQFIESLVQIICGTYSSEVGARSPDDAEKGTREPSEKAPHTHTDTATGEGSHDHENNECPVVDEAVEKRRRLRTAAVASSNAAELLCSLIATGCASDGASSRSRTSWALLGKLASGGGPRMLLQAVFTCPVVARAHALAHATRLLRRLLEHHATIGEDATPRSQVELAVAPHLPLLHQALLRDPSTYAQEEGDAETLAENKASGECAVGAARVQTAELLAHLACSEVEEVATTMLTLGTPGVLADMFFQYPNNNFLHAALLALVRNALANPVYRTQYTAHLLVECDLLTRLMDAFEANQNKQVGVARAGYMGHVTLVLSRLQCALAEDSAALDDATVARWKSFCEEKLDPALHHFTQPLGGSYPSENSYEEADSSLSDRLTSYYDASGTDADADSELSGLGAIDLAVRLTEQYRDAAKNKFLELADQRFDDDMWDDGPESEEPPAAALGDVVEGSPWESEAGGGAEPASSEEGWAQFSSALGSSLPPADPFSDSFQGGFPHYWPYEGASDAGSDALLPAGGSECVSLANNLLTAMSAMSPAAIANIVNANLSLEPLQHADGEMAAPLSPTDLPEESTHNTSDISEASGDTDTQDLPSSEDTAIDGATAKSKEETNVENSLTENVVKVTGTDVKVTESGVTAANVDADDASSTQVTVVKRDASDAISEAPVAKVTTNVVENISNSIDTQTTTITNSIDSKTLTEQSNASDSPQTQTNDLNEITDKLNAISLQNQESDDSNSTAKSLDNEKVLDAPEEASEAAER